MYTTLNSGIQGAKIGTAPSVPGYGAKRLSPIIPDGFVDEFVSIFIPSLE
jgi:hypothetical protein